MHDLVVGTLQEARVDRKHRLQPVACHTGGTGHGVLLRDAHIEETIREFLCEGTEPGAVRHRGGDADDFLILAGEATQRLREDSGVALLRWRECLSGFHIERRHPVIVRRIVLRRCIALALRREDMHENRMIDLFRLLDGPLHLTDVVTIDRPEVGDAHILEQHTRNEELLQRVLRPLHPLYELWSDARHAHQRTADIDLQLIITTVRTQSVQVLRHTADISGDRHLVVVQHDDEVFLHLGCVIESLIRETAGQCAVTDDGHDGIVLALDIAGRGDAESGGNRGGAVSRAEAVKRTLRPLRETTHPMILPESVEVFLSTRQDFMGIGLMADVPHDLILRQIEGQIQPDGQLHHPEIRGEVASVLGGFLYDKLSDFGRELLKLPITQLLQILWSMYIIQ